jgi:hypothetical protein
MWIACANQVVENTYIFAVPPWFHQLDLTNLTIEELRAFLMIHLNSFLELLYKTRMSKDLFFTVSFTPC